jgi:hypothetical protein
VLSVKALGLRVWGSGFEVWELGFKDRELGSARSRHVPVYREPDKTLELLSGKPHNLPQLKKQNRHNRRWARSKVTDKVFVLK